ncbi:GPP34 family phosphoprotein [Oerskovia turbata]|uniref:GPP34 family phosphoprotein n=1 Tax=Oerskovia turbata TaxID=1713 RepID=A0A4Q1KZ09_9CELL|nr:GPP34 family phosphoprotein [Oerskovia turbata]RXR26851.1 GPP34 family phosphoprotein [Oerskovia turbata]RXR34584.1 GPP34 family phosphoprotein [Oerskovia turbata]
MLIIEDYLLLVLDDVTGRPVGDASYLQQVAAGALLVELALTGRVDLAGDSSGWRSGRVVVRDQASTGSALLDDALVTVKSKEGSTPKSLVEVLSRSRPADVALDGLVQRGLLRREEGRILGIFPTTRWPAADSRHEGDVRRTLTQVLRDGVAPDERTGALVAILAATKQAGRVMAAGAELSATARREIDHRAKEIAEGSWAAGATRRYVEEITAATAAALTTTVVIAGAQP